MIEPVAVPAAPRTVAVPLPDDAGEPVAVPVAVAAQPRAKRARVPLAGAVAARKLERAQTAAREALHEPEREPDAPIPFEPLKPGELVDMLVDTGQVTPESLPDVERVAWERRQAASGRAADDAPVTVADAVPALRRLLADPNISAADAAALVLALSRVSDAARDAPASKPLCELTHAELCERVSECDTRRAQLLAAIAAAGGPTPGRGGDSRGA